MVALHLAFDQEKKELHLIFQLSGRLLLKRHLFIVY